VLCRELWLARFELWHCAGRLRQSAALGQTRLYIVAEGCLFPSVNAFLGFISGPRVFHTYCMKRLPAECTHM